MTRRPRYAGLPGFREASPDRKLLSVNDWWGFGVLAALGEDWRGSRVHYMGKRAAGDQYRAGFRYGMELLDEAAETTTVLSGAGSPDLP